jgi:hypothetical protein
MLRFMTFMLMCIWVGILGLAAFVPVGSARQPPPCNPLSSAALYEANGYDEAFFPCRSNPVADDSPCLLSSRYRSENWVGGVCSNGQQIDYDAAIAATVAFFAANDITPSSSPCSPNFVDFSKGSGQVGTNPRPEQFNVACALTNIVVNPIDNNGAVVDFPLLNGLPFGVDIRANINRGLPSQGTSHGKNNRCAAIVFVPDGTYADACLKLLGFDVPSNEPAPALPPVRP